MRGQVNSFPPHGRHINDAFPGLWPLRFRRLPLVRQRQQYDCCQLIFKLPVLWRSGAAARLSSLHTPVETGTPPRRRKVQPTPLPIMAKTSFAPLFLLSKTDPLHWVPFWTAALPPEKENVCSVVCLRDSVKSDRTGTAGAPVRMRLLKDYIILSPVQGTPHQRCQR